MLTRFNRFILSGIKFSTETLSNPSIQSLVEVGDFPQPAKHFKQLEYNPWQAIHLVKMHANCSFEQTIDLVVRINVNPKNGDQIVRGSAIMPSGIGKQTIVAVLANQEHLEMCQKAGADIVDRAQIMKQIKANKITFEKLFTTPQILPELKQYAKVLGPKGLMPNLKVGTLISKDKMVQSIKIAKAGQVTYRVDAGKNVHVPIGKINFTETQLLDNMQSFVKSLTDKKPAAIKGKYFMDAYLKSSMGPRWKLKIEWIDPKHKFYIMDMR